MKPAIVVVTFNRPDSLARLLKSIAGAEYDQKEITLIISVDFQESEGHEQVLKVADGFNWSYGEKRVIKHTTNLGLRKHVLSCGDLVTDFDSIVMLEDDLIVSRYFYLYAAKALEFYAGEEAVGGISLYNHRTNYSIGLPFEPVLDEFDVYFLQIAASWGQAWTRAQWKSFKDWYDQGWKISDDDNLPEHVKSWPESSWVKYFIKFLVDKRKYFSYPKTSFSTNMGVPGTHHKQKEYTYSVPIHYRGNLHYIRFAEFSESVNVYDSFFEIEADVLGRTVPELKKYGISTVDLYGLKDLKFYEGTTLLSSKSLKNPVSLLSFGLDLKPMILNILLDIKGDHFHVAQANDFNNEVKHGFVETDWEYNFGKIQIREYVNVSLFKIRKKILSKMKKGL